VVIPNPVKGGRVTRPSRDARQFQTHLQLLAYTSARRRASLDAIIVPASRPAIYLDHAVTLARAVNCQLVVLCSLKAKADEVNELLALRNFTRAVVVDLPESYVLPKVDLVTSKPFSLDLPDNCVNPNGDLSIKRNIGMLLARMVGWERIFFLDDDIRDLDSFDLREAATMLGPYGAVGMRAVDFPDNSVVCHGNRKTGGYQDVFISGSVLGVHCAEAVAFFPEIYNEDWFFFYHAAEARRLGRHDRDATQLCYDPFADPQRAAGQEFGDVMAEGLYGLLHYRIGADHATRDYWQTFLDSRMRFLKTVLARSEGVEPYLRKRITLSIETAMKWSRQIDPSMCEHYIALWKKDLDTWEQRLKDVSRQRSARAALGELDLVASGRSPYALAGIMGDGDGFWKDASKGKVPIASSLAPDIMSMISSQGFGVIADNDSGLSFGRDLPSQEHNGDVPAGSAISRVSRRASELVRRVMIAEERPEPVDAFRDRDRRPLISGRHRRASELVPAVLSSSIEDASS
jgi:glycosyltransferase involved in cell wall biosynthesis